MFAMTNLIGKKSFNGTWQDYNTMNDAAKALGMGGGSIANNLKSNGVCNNGYRFKTTVPNFPRP